LEYPLYWDPSLRYFQSQSFTSSKNQAIERDLLVLKTGTEVSYLSTSNASLSFGAQFSGVPVVDLASLAIGEVAGERISHPPDGPRFGQHDVDQIAFRGHPDGEWRSEAQPRSAAPGTSLDERQPGGSQRRGPSRGHLALCHVGRGQVAGDDQTPALAGLGGRIRKLRHVC